ncbi:UNVERIFIED_CONTAM: Alpha-N-acetylglucosaminidase [Sesamum angustifolium]|uniref:Alpha-N-acetylglucosaminidase n=1 Tax=Sesamum angustifolium TaxID=2727405 RepID=A0AAW2Q9Y1_9LAMI
MAAFASSLCFSPIRMMMGFWVLLFLFGINWVPLADSSTLGVEYVSRLLEIQDRERAPPSVQVSAAYAALNRLIPSHSSSFQFSIISKAYNFSSLSLLVIDVYESKPHHVAYWLKCERGIQDLCGGEPCFKLNNHPAVSHDGSPEILISGTTGVELLSGLHWYLKYWCGAHISWRKTGGAQLSSVPKSGSLPRIQDAGITMKRPTPWCYYQNAVSSSYTFAWWDWERWEKEIDWMALQGINLPLAFTGQEAIWQKVFQNFNISAPDLDDFFGGPAFLHGHEWEIYTVLPAFSGNVPAALKSVYPSAKIARLGNWFTVRSDPRWCCTYLLDATDPLFIEIGRAFIMQQLKEYGRSSHIYNCDTFDENTPPSDDPEYISSLAAAIFRGMESGDDEAVWLMQALLHSVPVGKLVVLDLYAEVKPVWATSEQFYGLPYIWCMLHNFAGNIEMWLVSGCQWKASSRILSFMILCLKWHFDRTELTSRYDLIDLTRQALAKYANQLFLKVVEAYQLGDLHAVTHRSQKFLSLVEDLDTLLACHDGFLVGPWLESAKQLAQNDEQKKQFEWNARTQITMWFDNTEEEASLLRDYGNKYWSGLLRDYYGPRAAIYFKFLIQSLERGDGFRLREWRKEWIKLTMTGKVTAISSQPKAQVTPSMCPRGYTRSTWKSLTHTISN